MDYNYLLDHAKGALFGQAIGDSFGIPALLRPEDTEKVFGWITRFETPTLDHPAHAGFPAGHITDDTEQAITLAQIFLRDRKVTVEGTAEGICAWYDRIDGDNSVYVGPSTRKAVNALKGGKDPHTTGFAGDTNGSGMRVSPVGIMNAGNPDNAAAEALQSCVPSHYTYAAVAGTCAVAAAIARGMMPGATIDDMIQEGIKQAEANFFKAHPWFASNVSRKIELGVSIARDSSRTLKQKLYDIYDFIGGGFLADQAIPSAFALLALGEGDVMKTAEYAVNMSGDADTIGAMAVAMAGAYAGFHTIPEDVIKTVETVNPEWPFEETAKGLCDLAWERLGN